MTGPELAAPRGPYLPATVKPRFLLQITSIEELAAFIALIRGEPIDAAQITNLTNALHAERTSLAEAIAKQPPPG